MGWNGGKVKYPKRSPFHKKRSGHCHQRDCQSRYQLMSGCEFFNITFSIPNGDPNEGASDAFPVVLPVGSMEFNVYLLFGRM